MKWPSVSSLALRLGKKKSAAPAIKPEQEDLIIFEAGEFCVSSLIEYTLLAPAPHATEESIRYGMAARGGSRMSMSQAKGDIQKAKREAEKLAKKFSTQACLADEGAPVHLLDVYEPEARARYFLDLKPEASFGSYFDLQPQVSQGPDPVSSHQGNKAPEVGKFYTELEDNPWAGSNPPDPATDSNVHGLEEKASTHPGPQTHTDELSDDSSSSIFSFIFDVETDTAADFADDSSSIDSFILDFATPAAAELAEDPSFSIEGSTIDATARTKIEPAEDFFGSIANFTFDAATSMTAQPAEASSRSIAIPSLTFDVTTNPWAGSRTASECALDNVLA
ncbi:hypothetical protein B0T26DRAFT_793481 [Lasiosphaeria miniovina]|uniref:Uncharacterized protein n=1 Tax=Lasiosphaeria miniovina TaxID=1954250 RepID=A0AA40DHE0_9PEZI|nr:uncharacterized protein B0T26DRAFT_793481 [Lasiosphaeria miniovina]KAK0703624.1 hypothetical protein B0T26DRAFT_793481 [Lasiosphaeria miniovina]